MGTGFDITDSFATSNRFHGAEIGGRWQETYQCYSLELLAKLAFGSTRQQVNIAGNTITTQNGATTNAQGGLLAQTTNIGTYTRNRFALVPELGATMDMRLTATGDGR